MNTTVMATSWEWWCNDCDTGDYGFESVYSAESAAECHLCQPGS